MKTEKIEEAKIITKVNSKGQKRKRVKCKKGFKLSSNGKSCVPISGGEKTKKKKAMRKAVKTLKAKGSGAQKRKEFKRKKALRKRKSYNL